MRSAQTHDALLSPNVLDAGPVPQKAQAGGCRGASLNLPSRRGPLVAHLLKPTAVKALSNARSSVTWKRNMETEKTLRQRNCHGHHFPHQTYQSNE